jgi:hypothetical protein
MKELYSLFSKSEYASLFLFKLEVSRMLGKLVIKFGVNDDSEEEEEDEDKNYDSDDCDGMWDRAIKMVE